MRSSGGTPNYVAEAANLSAAGPRLVDGVADRLPVRVKRSARVVYLSDAGVTMDADFNDVTVGTDVSAVVQAICDTAPTVGRLRIVIDGVIKVGDLKLRSNTTLEGLGWQTGIVQAANSRSAIRNYNYRSPYTGGSHNGQIVDENITVRNLQIHGNHLNAAANPLRTGSWTSNLNYLKAKSDGELVHPVKFFGVRNNRIENLYVRDPACFHCNVANIDGGVYRNIRFYDSANAATPTNAPNTGGLQVQGPANDLTIECLTGSTSDDAVALNAEDWNLVPGGDPSALQGAASWGGGWDAVYKGDIVRVDVRNVNVNTSSTLRLLSATNLIDKVTISGVRGRATFSFLDTRNNIPGVSGSGNIGRVTVDDIDLPSLSDAGAEGFILLGANTKQLELSRIRRNTLTAPVADSIRCQSGTVEHLTIDGYTVDETSGSGTDLIRIEGGTIRYMAVRNVSWGRPGLSLSACAVVRQNAGTVTALSLANVTVDGAAWVYVKFGGTCADLLLHGVQHRNAGGNATVALNTGETLPRLRGSALSTALFATGTITDLRTDNTNDDAAADFGSATLASDYAATTSSASVGLSVTLPRAGTYSLLAIARADQQAGAYLTLRLYDATNAAQVGGVVLSQYVPGINTQVTVPVAGTVRVTGSTVVRLEARRTGGNGSVLVNADGQTVLYYMRIGA